jgi:hypothetical protein
MKGLAVVIRTITDILKKYHKRRHCESEEFWAGPYFGCCGG